MTPSRQPAATDFHVTVEGVGRFRFAQRRMEDEMKIAVEYSLITQGIDTPSVWLTIMGGATAQLRVLTVEAPDGWDIDEMDPLDDETYARIVNVHRALRDQERSFREKKTKAREESRPGSGEGAGVLVPPEIQPGAD